MNCPDCQQLLHADLDGALPPGQRADLEAHLAACPACRRERDQLARLRAATRALPREIDPPRDLWPAISARVAPRKPAPPLRRWWLPAAGLAAASLVTLLWIQRPPAAPIGPGWTVTPLAGAPQVDARGLAGEGTLRVGQWLVTGEDDRASLAVGAIGHVEVAPRSRLRLLAAGDGDDHRLELREGTLSAFIWAPPRLFFVETPAATAVDLGCAYTLTVDDTGAGELQVTAGYVALEHGARSAVIPAGLRCAMNPQTGPGTPFVDDASDELRKALRRFDATPGPGDADAIPDVLLRSGSFDTITLWHVLRRAPADRRGPVYDRLATFAPPPAGITRDGVLRADPTMIARWGEALGLAVVGDVR